MSIPAQTANAGTSASFLAVCRAPCGNASCPPNAGASVSSHSAKFATTVDAGMSGRRRDGFTAGHCDANIGSRLRRVSHVGSATVTAIDVSPSAFPDAVASLELSDRVGRSIAVHFGCKAPSTPFWPSGDTSQSRTDRWQREPAIQLASLARRAEPSSSRLLRWLGSTLPVGLVRHSGRHRLYPRARAIVPICGEWRLFRAPEPSSIHRPFRRRRRPQPTFGPDGPTHACEGAVFSQFLVQQRRWWQIHMQRRSVSGSLHRVLRVLARLRRDWDIEAAEASLDAWVGMRSPRSCRRSGTRRSRSRTGRLAGAWGGGRRGDYVLVLSGNASRPLFA